MLRSCKFPIGVDTIYKPFSNLFISFIFIVLAACTPAIYSLDKAPTKNDLEKKQLELSEKKEVNIDKHTNSFYEKKILSEVEIILPQNENILITKSLTNSFEVSVYKKEIDNLQLNINQYYDSEDLRDYIKTVAKPGKIFVGTLNSNSTKIVKEYCNKGILFFSFAGNKNLAGDCVYLINFFPEDDLRALFKYFPEQSRIALLFPENYYGYKINQIIDEIASTSKSLIINRASYKEDLSNVREAIRELGKYELRKYELQRQKKILENKKDEDSKKTLNKIKKFETIGNVDFTHLILPDYGIRLLEVAPLLPFYDVDPKKVQFVGTGVWDDKLFFDEPALQGAIFSGIEEKNRVKFFNDYYEIYLEKPIRTATIPFDLVALISFIIDRNMKMKDAIEFLEDSSIKFEGIDGKFYFSENVIVRNLDILKIKNGKAKKIK